MPIASANQKPAIRLYTRGDDAGSSRSANRAIRRTVEAGWIRNVSLMAPAHEIEDAAVVLKGVQGCAFGLHLTLNAEWANARWKPLLPAGEVPCLIGPDGALTASPDALQKQGVVVGQVVAEAGAQLRRLRALGFDIAYVDEHMGVGQLPGLREPLAEFCRREGIFYLDREVPYLPGAESGINVDAMRRRIGQAGSGAFSVYCHPTFDDDEMRGVSLVWDPTAFGIGRERALDTAACLDPEFPRWCREAGVELVAVDRS